MRKRLAAVAAAGLAGGAFSFAAPALADHPPSGTDAVSITHEVADCGEVTFGTTWQIDAPLDTARLVVDADGEVKTAAIGEALTVGPFAEEQVTIRYRVFGGGERDYDNPLWAGHPASGDGALPLAEFRAGINDYIDKNGDEWTLGAGDDPFTRWHQLTVNGCPVAEPPGVEPPAGEEPVVVDPADLPCEGVDQLKELIDEVGIDELVEAFNSAEFIEQSGVDFEPNLTAEHLNALFERCADDSGQGGGDGGDDDKGGLPVTSGTPLPMLIGGGVLLLLAGGTAVLLARRRRVTIG